MMPNPGTSGLQAREDVRARARAILALVIAAVMLPGVACAGGWDVFGPDGSYQGRIERGGDGTLERFGADGSYQGRYDRGRDGWDAFGAGGNYEGRLTGDGERGLPGVIGGARP